MEKIEHEISYVVSDIDVFEIISKKIGKIGYIVFQEKLRMWSFLPIENFFYKPVHLAIILSKLNSLNDYKKEEKNSYTQK